MSLGHVMIAGHRFNVEKVYLHGGEVRIEFTVPPGPGFRGPITVFGDDGQGCWQGKTLIFPDRTNYTVFSYAQRFAAVLSGDEVLDVSTLPGWR